MPSPTTATEPRTATPVGPASTDAAPGTAVLDRVAARVRQRLETEQSATSRVGDGSHAASIIWPWPV
ncbi:HaaA family cyclophane-containing RiPP peptide [Streptomyces sp. 7N604]|uniref:HaaA family cyclophane-containing RiPP peptide n=1 Tax=Streptomyces sp. 7N604 TaxID=3457415 RepID=UPI003FD02575